MRYERDFTIGVRETQAFYQALTLRAWWKGLVGFGAVGALVVWMYASRYAPGLGAPAMLGLCLLGVPASAGLAALVLILRSRLAVREQAKKNGRESYVQHVEISGLGVHVTVGKTTGKADFGKLLRVRETRRAFYLFLTPNQAWILPKDQMEDAAAESRELREMFSRVMERGRLELLSR